MSTISREIINMLDMLPQKEQEFACEIIKRIILAWDPDFTKLTPKEEEELKKARAEIARGEFVRHEDIDWN